MSAYKEVDICSGGVPLVEPTLCPSTLISPVPEDLSLTITMGDNSYSGYLKTDVPDRITRVARLVGELWKRLNWISAQFSTTLTHTFSYPRTGVTVNKIPDKKISGSAFEFVRQMLFEIDSKMNSLTADLDEIRPVASIPEHWQIRKEAARPIAVFLFGEWNPGDELIQSPKWQISVPYFVPGDISSFDNSFGYTKGSYQYLYTLSDNSKIIFYGDNPAEMEVVLQRWLSHVSSDKLSGGFLKSGHIKGLPFSVRKLRLQRIDYYSEGILKSTPTQYIKFPRRPIEMPTPPPG